MLTETVSLLPDKYMATYMILIILGGQRLNKSHGFCELKKIQIAEGFKLLRILLQIFCALKKGITHCIPMRRSREIFEKP